jgi:hypothetical protein
MTTQTIRVYLKGNLLEAGKDMHSMHQDVGARPYPGMDQKTMQSLWYYDVPAGTDLDALSATLSKYPFFDKIERGPGEDI